MERLREQYRIASEEDWYRLSLKQIRAAGGSGALKHHGHSPRQLLQVAYPEENWSRTKAARRDKRSVQRWMFLKIQELFPGRELIEDFFCAELARDSGQVAQFDVYIPSLRAAFEFHGIHHYQDLPAFGQVDMYQGRDQEKEALCSEHEIALVV